MKSNMIVGLMLISILLLVGCGNDLEILEPVDLADPFVGPEDAEIVVIEYSDFQCPYCGAAAGINDQLIGQFKSQHAGWEPAVVGLKALAAEGKIKLVFKHFPLGFHNYAQKAAEAAEAASAQGMFWEYHDKLFANPNDLSEKDLIKYAGEVGLDVDQFTRELQGEAYAASVKRDALEGSRAGVTGTPSFFVNGVMFEGAQPFSAIEAEINKLLAASAEDTMEDAVETKEQMADEELTEEDAEEMGGESSDDEVSMGDESTSEE